MYFCYPHRSHAGPATRGAAPPSKLQTMLPPTAPPSDDYAELSIDPATGVKYRAPTEKRHTYVTLEPGGLERNQDSVRSENMYEQIDHTKIEPPPAYPNPSYDEIIVPAPEPSTVRGPTGYVNQAGPGDYETHLPAPHPPGPRASPGLQPPSYRESQRSDGTYMQPQ